MYLFFETFVCLKKQFNFVEKISKVVVRPQPQHVINRVIERPITPPPIVVHKEVTELAPPPVYTTRFVNTRF